jgi:hypothetical protein
MRQRNRGVDVEQPGRALSHDIPKGEIVETDLDRFIEGRDRMRRLEEGERAEEQAWVESTRIHNEKRRRQARAEWHWHHMTQAERLRRTLEALIEHHEERAQELASLGSGGDAP